MNVNEQHRVVKESLSKFIKKNIPGANLKNVDQIVLEYVISILEEASQDESFDVEGNPIPRYIVCSKQTYHILLFFFFL